MKFEPPGAGQWDLDRSHYEGGITPIVAAITTEAISTAYRKLFKVMGVPAETLDVRIVNGFFYHRIRPLVGADKSMSRPPPTWAISLLSRIHPEFRRRNAAAQRTLDQKPWEAVVAQWNNEIRPRLTKRNLEFQQVKLNDLSDAELADHLDELITHLQATNEEHHRLHGYDLGPIGELLLAGMGWGVTTSEMLSTLVGASPSTQDPARKLTAIRDVVSDSGGSLNSLEGIRASSAEAAELLDAYIERHGYLLYAGYDIDSPALIERPDVLLSSIRSAKAPIDVASLASDAAKRVRGHLTPEDQDEFDSLLHSARAAMDMRDSNGPLTVQWPLGLTRLAMMEAGKRLVGKGRLVAAEHILELEIDELGDFVRSGLGPSSDELAKRSEGRMALAKLDPPSTLGPPEPPPPLDALPQATAKLLAIVTVLTEELLTTATVDPEALASRVFSGTGIGSKNFVGIARTAATAEEAMADMEPDEILVTRTTSPAYNLVLSMAGGLVTETGGAASHAAVLSRELDLPAVIGAAGCLQGITNGDRIEIDPGAGTVKVLQSLQETTVAAAAVDGDWRIYEGDEENLLRARFNMSFIKATDRSAYPVETVVTVVLDNPDLDEMPHSSLVAELDHVEELIIQLEHEQAVFAGAITTPETQTFVLYARSSEWIAEVHTEIEEALGDQPVQIMTKTDPEWTSYCDLVEASR